MVRGIIFSLCLLLSFLWMAVAAPCVKAASIAVMDIGVYQGTMEDGFVVGEGNAAADFIIDRLVEHQLFDIKDKDSYMEKLKEKEEIITSGSIDGESAQEIGRALGVDYLIYGNILNVGTSETGTYIMGSGVTVCTVHSHVMLRMLDVASGKIVAVASGEGKSKSSYVKAKLGHAGTVGIGAYTVTIDSVHNAIEKASCDAIEKIMAKPHIRAAARL